MNEFMIGILIWYISPAVIGGVLLGYLLDKKEIYTRLRHSPPDDEIMGVTFYPILNIAVATICLILIATRPFQDDSLFHKGLK